MLIYPNNNGQIQYHGDSGSTCVYQDPVDGLVATVVYNGAFARCTGATTRSPFTYREHLLSLVRADNFGTAMATADFDGDGFLDLAVGAPGEALGPGPHSGAVYLYKGFRAWFWRGVTGWGYLSQSGIGLNELGDWFGSSLAAGDVNGDGYADLLVAAPGEERSVEDGVVFVFRGRSDNLPAAWTYISQEGLGIPEDRDWFGAAVAIGDFDGDLYADVAVGATGEDAGSVVPGYVFVFNGSRYNVTPSRGFSAE